MSTRNALPRPPAVYHSESPNRRSMNGIGLYEDTARLMSLALQHGALLEKVGDLVPRGNLIPAARHLQG
jgi:hypothetical protein